LARARTGETIGVMALHSPFATVIWDYINRGMPIGKEGTLQPDEVYALTAFLLFKNGVIKEDDVMDAHSVPQVVDAESRRLRDAA
jgi:S-disulfanyl-L-cysteine oxidoreductase SoxD